jgi:hypothetical protein
MSPHSNRREITRQDVLPLDAYEAVRAEKRATLLPVKQKRRLSVGPDATFYFENFDTMWMQIQEMLRIEKGGEAQIEDELHAYNPLIPQGNELVATVMFEIGDAARRKQVLSGLGGVEDAMTLEFEGEVVPGEPEQDVDRTTAAGKASSVQFVHFRMTPEQMEKFKRPGIRAVIGINHANYAHMAVLPEETRAELAGDLD